MTQPGKHACHTSVPEIMWYISFYGGKATKHTLEDLFISNEQALHVIVPDHLYLEFEGFEVLMGRRFEKFNWNTNNRLTIITDYNRATAVAYPIDPELITKDAYRRKVRIILSGDVYTIDNTYA